jgi:2-C-methyl-D-erythritol 2,4-cyclodiphosphate synthase
MGLAPDRIGVKATTNEGIGAVGRGEAIAAHAVALIGKP